MENIYQHKHVGQIITFYGGLLTHLTYTTYNLNCNRDSFRSIQDHLSAVVTKMYEGIQLGEVAPRIQISNYHPHYLGKSTEELAQIDFSLADCQLTISKEYGFADWATLEADLGDTNYDFLFRQALDALLSGNLATLKLLLSKHPDLVIRKSQYGHEATLLHYVASNGVEMWRQQVPLNLPELTRLLLEKGADINAEMKVYGGKFTTKALLETSAHPFEAGIAEEMINVLNSQK